MPGLKILGTGRCVPKKIFTNEDLSRRLDTSDDWIVQRTGIKKRHIRDENTAVHTLAVTAAKEALAEAEKNRPGFTKNDISAVIVGTMTSDFVFPSTACILQKELDLLSDIRAFDICAACTGFVYSLQSAYEYLKLKGSGFAIVVGSECMSSLLNYEDRSTCILFGDGAGAVVIEYDGSEKSIFLEAQGTEGNMTGLYCEKKAGRFTIAADKNSVMENTVGIYQEKTSMPDGFLHMNGSEVYRFATASLHRAIENLLSMSGKSMDDIDMVVCHQANARIVDSVSRRYKGHEHKFFKNMDEYANTSAASVAIAMDDMFKKGLLKSGQTIITAAFGAGLSWSAALMTI